MLIYNKHSAKIKKEMLSKSIVQTYKELKPIIKWPGGKEKELPYIKSHIPQSFENYYEPFVGGGSVFTAFEAKHMYINDKSNELIGLYRCIATQDKTFFMWIDNIKTFLNMYLCTENYAIGTYNFEMMR